MDKIRKKKYKLFTLMVTGFYQQSFSIGYGISCPQEPCNSLPCNFPENV